MRNILFDSTSRGTLVSHAGWHSVGVWAGLATLVLLGVLSFAMVSRAGIPAFSGGGPPNGQSFVPIEALVDITANEALTVGTVNTTNVTLYTCTGATDAVTCATPDTSTNKCTAVALSNSDRTITCTTGSLVPSTTYKFTIGTGVQTASTSQGAAAATVRIFRTGSIDFGTNTTPPRIESVTPSGTSMPTNLSSLIATFAEGPSGNMLADGTANAINNPANFRLQTINTSTGVFSGTDLCQGGAIDSCNLAFSGRALTVTGITFAAGARYDACIVSGVRNTAGIGLSGDYCWTFGMGASTDSTVPALRTEGTTVPANGDVDISIYTPTVRVYFTETMNTSTVNTNTVRLYADADTSSTLNGAETVIAGTLVESTDGGIGAIVQLPTALTANTRYCFSVVGGGTGVKDIAGNAMTATVQNKCFTTIAAESALPAPALDYVDADNYNLTARFNQPMQTSSAQTIANYALECPTGVPVSLTGKTATYFPDRQEVEIQGLGLSTGASCQLTVTGVKNLAAVNISTSGGDNVEAFTVLDSATTGGFLGGGGMGQDFMSGTNMGTFWENPEFCEPQTRLAGATSSVFCEFPAPAAMASGSTITLTWPTGFSVGSVIAKANSWSNVDINGPAANAPTIASVAVNGTARTVALTTGTAAIASGDRVHFELSGLTLPATATTSNRVTIVVKDNTGVKIGQTITASPFDLNQGGDRSISGSVFKDTDGDGVKDAGEGLNTITVFCDQMGGFFEGTSAGGWVGHQETTTNSEGVWTIGSLSNGQYGCGMPPNPTGFANLMAGNQWRDVKVDGANVSGVNFKFTDLDAAGSGAQTLSVTVDGTAGLATKQIDVFCSAGASDFQFSAPVMKTVTLNGSGDGTTTLKLLGGKNYDCGVGPHMDFSNFTSGPPPVPEFSFLPPPFQRVAVPTASAPSAITFSLTSADNTISVAVCDGGTNDASTCGTATKGTGISNAYVNANPLGCFNTDGSFKDCRGGYAQTNSNGVASVKVTPGAYRVEVFMPGMPPAEAEVTVLTDGTVTQKGTTVTTVFLSVAKSSTTIAGTVKDESGNGISYAHVSAEKVATSGTCTTFTPQGAFRDTPTNSNGVYTLYVGAGTWNIRAFSSAYGEVGCTTVVMASTSLSSQDIQATAGNFNTISGTAPEGVFVNAFGSSGGNSVMATGGTYTMKVKAGTYTVDCFGHGKGPCGRSENVNASSGNATVNFGTTLTVGTVTVTITGISDAFVDLRDSSGLGAGTGVANSGVYSLSVPAGTYTLRGGSPKYGDICTAQTVTVTANVTTAVTCTPPANLRTVSGRITDGTSNVAGATILFTDDSGASFKVTSTGQGGSNNNLSATNVPDGTYTVKAQKNGYDSASTTATVSGGDLTLSSSIALTQATGTNGETVTIPTQVGGSAYLGDGRVVATTGSGTSLKSIIADIDETTGEADLDLTNGTWMVKAIGQNGKVSSTSTVVVTNGAVVGSTPTLGMDTAITGFTAATDSATLSPKSGVKANFPNVATGFEVNIPSSVLSTSDSSTGKVEVKKDPTVIDIINNADPNTAAVGSSGYEITPKDSNGNALGADSTPGATITVPYDDSDVVSAGVSENSLVFTVIDANGQPEAFSTVCDAILNLCTVSMEHFSSGGLIGTTLATTSTGTVTVTSGGGGAGGVSVPATTVTANTPGGVAASIFGGANTVLSWSKSGNATDVDLYVSYDDGVTYTQIASHQGVNNNYVWATPNVKAAKAKIRVAVRNGGEVLDTDESGVFAIVVDGAKEEVTVDSVQSVDATASVLVDVTLANGAASTLKAGSLFRGVELSGVYYVDANGTRRVFPDEGTYFSYYDNFDSVVMVQDDQLRKLALGKRMRMNSGALIKIQSDPKVYEVQSDGTIRHVPNETTAASKYGANWAKLVRDVSVVFFFDYNIGTALASVE